MTKKVKDLTQAVLKDFQLGYEVMHKPYREFNDMSVLDRQAVRPTGKGPEGFQFFYRGAEQRPR
jgi:hypothetical protein